MPKTTNENFIAEKNADKCKPIFLYTLYDYDGANNDLYFAEWDENVTFDGQTYIAFPITHDSISENTIGQIDKVRISLCNISRYIQAILETYDLRNKKVDIAIVFEDQLADTEAVVTETYWIGGYTADQENVMFTLTSKFDLLEVTLPLRKYTRNQCAWKYNESECGVSSAIYTLYSTCPRTLAACRIRQNSERFGGFPSIPQRNIFIG
jgi:lambda family phage minor tail protein L